MTVSTTDSVVEYVSGGPAFPIPYRFLLDSDIQAVLIKQDGTSESLVLGTQYTLIGAGSQDGGALTSAYATLILSAPGATLTISRVMPAVQPTDLRNQGRYFAETHENVFDRLTMLIQQGFALLGRALLRPFGKDYYDAVGRNISNLADPVVDQDAATKGWAGRYFADLIDGATGLINTTTGILYDAGTLFDYLRFGVNRSVDSIAALRLLSGARNQRAFVLGYYAKGDGGGGHYWLDASDVTSADNGGTVIVALDGSRWKLKYKDALSVKQFGAKGDGATDDTVSIQNTIDALPARGGSVMVPSGTYVISSVIRIGDGDGGTTFSTKNGIKLKGAGAGFAVSGALVPTIFTWTGVSVTAMISINGRISDCEISDLFLSCNGSSSGLTMTAFSGCTVSNLKIVNPATGGNGLTLLGGVSPTGNYNIYNKFSKISIGLLSPTSTGLYVDGNYAAVNDTWLTTFDLVRIETVAGATSARCAWLKFIDSCTFTRCHFDSKPEPTSLGLILDATGNPGFLNDYPIGLSFYDCSISKIDITEDVNSKIGPCYFYGHGANDLEVIPTHPRLFGITANGDVFGPLTGFKNKVASDVTVQNNTGITSIYSFAVGPYFMGGVDSFKAKNGGFRARHTGFYVNSSGATSNFIITVSFGGITLFTAAFAAVPSGATGRSVDLSFMFFLSNNTTTNEAGQITAVMGAVGSVTGGAAVPYQTLTGANSIAVDTSVSKTLDISVQHSVASGSIAYTAKQTVLELL